MEVIGIICEYNPFHNGHLYHINQIKNKYPNSLIVLVLNGYFLERGEISTISKYDKTKIALENQIDIVLELPVLYGTQSADTFAYTAVNILSKLNVNKIIFGSETNDIKKLTDLAKKSLKMNDSSEIKELLDQGINYPTALAKGLKTSFSFEPNDLLGISYIKAIMQINKKIVPETIKRTNDYHQAKKEDGFIISASAIREKLKLNEDIKLYLPDSSYKMINQIDFELLFKLLKTIINRDEYLNEILDVDEGIEYRLKKSINNTQSIDEFIKSIKTKRYTYNKINRMLIHIILGIKKKDAKYPLDYIKILGINKRGKSYLNKIKKDIDIAITPDKKSKIYDYELKATIIYDLLTNKNEIKKELSNKPIIY